MSKINAVRLINLNYNNNAIRISDETFRLHGESTLLSLRNGGGKSVLVQMMMAPFVHRRYQNAKDRPFASYFTTNKPTFILVEWKLDQGAGYVLTGMMVRKSQEISEERQDELEIVNFISEYKTRCQQDIDHLPVVEKTKKDVTLKGFAACRQLFDTYKRERGVPFFYYDMNNTAQARQYFNKLAEYRIYYKEWETIIKKVNLKESGLSDLFADCRDEKGLVEKWFLEAVENKLNQDRNRMKEFQGIMEKYTGQYRDNRSKIQRRDTIRAFGREAEQVRAQALGYREVSRQLKSQRLRIGDFIRRLHKLEEQEEEKAGAVGERLEGLARELEQLEYGKLSREFHEIAQRERYAQSNLEMLRVEEEGLERRREEILRKLHVLACGKQQETVKDSGQELDKERQRLDFVREKKENLEPERMALGGKLRQYYAGLKAGKEAEQAQCQEAVEGLIQERQQGIRKLEELRETENGLTEEAGALNARIRMFDEAEDRFNQEYAVRSVELGHFREPGRSVDSGRSMEEKHSMEKKHSMEEKRAMDSGPSGEAWSRNLLGEYEAGALEIRQAEYEKELGASEADRRAAKKDIEQYREQVKATRRLVEDKLAERSRLEANRKEAGRLLQDYDRELAERSVILRYVGMAQEDAFDTEKLLAGVHRKLLDADLARQGLEKELDALEKEYRRLAQGQVLELSEEFRGMLEEAGIHYVYGCEWLRKNQFSPERNRQLVARQPFLPYSLILSGQELERLRGLPDQVYTSAPVPILIRQELEGQGSAAEGTVQSFGELHFYVWFNDNLLEEEKLRDMLAQLDVRRGKLRRAIDTRQAEYMEYVSHQEKVKGQKVSKSAYETVKAEIAGQEKGLAALEQEILGGREELEALEERQAGREQDAAGLDRAIAWQVRRLADFGRFRESYREYRGHCHALEKVRQEKERVQNLQKLETEKNARREQMLETEKNRLALLERDGRACGEKLETYRQYPSPEESGETFTEAQAREAESRFEIITNGISARQKELEERVRSAQKRYDRDLEELEALAKKHGLAREDWEAVAYDRKEETHQEIQLEDQDRKLEKQRNLIHREEIQCALLRQEKDGKLREIRERCQREEPVPREEIQTIRFEDAIRELEYRQKEARKEKELTDRRAQDYRSNLTALAEYEEFAEEEPTAGPDDSQTPEGQGPDAIVWEFDLGALSGAELTKQKGLLIRDYNAGLEQRGQARASLDRALNRMVRMEEFGEDFYRKPLEAMLQLTEDAERVIRQLDTTIASYESLMEKLQVDISMVEKEKEKITELFGDYLKEVHENLGRIDRNSTITVRERPVKMLRVEPPDWAENESMFVLRLQDYIDDVTARGIALLEENGNLQEFLGTRITTRGLYDAVVGIGNIQIRLYKIEEQREYPITWADVAKNSGGEGFLSAFVILSALLYYMRKDDTDLFADLNEGKVLLMDNPFAQTNASHLLKPLMDMAKKANTQLICLTGLGGESIYNRFDNIYVLTLIAANLRNDMQYLRAEHMRGSEEETILATQIEVMEQQEFVF